MWFIQNVQKRHWNRNLVENLRHWIIFFSESKKKYILWSPELSTEVVTVTGDVGEYEGGSGEDYRRHPDEEQHQRSGLDNNSIRAIWQESAHVFQYKIPPNLIKEAS